MERNCILNPSVCSELLRVLPLFAIILQSNEGESWSVEDVSAVQVGAGG